MHGEIYQTSIDDGLRPELIKVRDHTLGSHDYGSIAI